MSGPVKVVKTKLFIGNLDPATQPGKWMISLDIFSSKNSFFLAEISELFAPYGSVLEASVIKDYGFVVRQGINLFILINGYIND